MPGADDTTALLKEVTTELEIGVGTVLEGQQMIELIEGLLSERAHPEYETVMVAKAAPPQTYDGVRGFREAMTDWLSPWAEFRFEVEEVIPVDDMLLLLGLPDREDQARRCRGDDRERNHLVGPRGPHQAGDFLSRSPGRLEGGRARCSRPPLGQLDYSSARMP